MTEPTTPNVPPAWYPDPAGGTRQRWWDGTQWTEHFQEPYNGVAVALTAPEGTKVYTVWIWIIILLPMLTYVPLLTIDWSVMFAGIGTSPSAGLQNQLALYTSPAYLTAVVGGWVIYLLNALFAFFDWRELGKRGVPKPFHFAWVFLSSLVYVIGRSVVTKRRTGHGSATLWAAIASIVLSFVLVGVMMAQMFSAIFEQVGQYSN